MTEEKFVYIVFDDLDISGVYSSESEARRYLPIDFPDGLVGVALVRHTVDSEKGDRLILEEW